MISELWDQLPTWVQWVVAAAGWIWIGIRNLWSRLPENLILFGLRIKLGGQRKFIETKTRSWLTWGDESIFEDDDREGSV